VESASPLDEAETTGAVGGARSAARASRSGEHPGWLSSSASHGRFEPGALLADRYRVTGRLGRGGMGEVYRADDLKLGQPVALKFLPEAFERDPVRVAQLHTEVRLSRQIAHRNVCRVYDVGEAEGLPFLSMEYVDGEDLATLLRRIGRLSQDKALDIARQLCAGVAAAHERGVLHRDLKPANVMIDGHGQVRITDFGLAALAGDVENVRAGTPAYMAPEQLAGREATVRSDIFALGLVLYEVFTGRRAFGASTIGDLVRQHEAGIVTAPSTIVADLDPAVERAILRCLEIAPERRPRSALAVAASLPGGDPLAAALAAGETPSPDMVAAAGERQAVGTRAAAAGAAVVLALIAAAAVVSSRAQITTRAPLDRAPAVLVDRAQQALAALGYAEAPADTSWGFSFDHDYVRYVADHPDFERAADPYATRPGALFFYYRTSPRLLTPQSPVGDVTLEDPPFTISGMTVVVLDTEGRLSSFQAIPPERDPRAGEAAAPDWDALFRLAELDAARFRRVEPEWLPMGLADARAAWSGALAERPEAPIRVEAAAWRGRPTYFQIIGPWTRPARMQEAPEGRGARVLNVLSVATMVVLLAAAVFVARANVRAGRGDRWSAARLGTVAALASQLTWVLTDPHPADAGNELNRLFQAIGEALFSGGVLSVMYLALEPAMRRYWPDSVVGSTRLLQGRVLDPRVGRDVLVGLAAGAGLQLLLSAQGPLQSLAGEAHDVVFSGNLKFFEGPLYVVGFFASLISFAAAFNAMWCVIAIVTLKRLLRRMWLAGVAATILLTLVAAEGIYVDQPGVFGLNVALAVSVVGLLVGVVVRFGLLTTVMTFMAIYALSSTPWSLAVGRWDFPAVALAFLILAATTVLAGWAARTEPRT
jgi:serine/threonine-protein kinase